MSSQTDLAELTLDQLKLNSVLIIVLCCIVYVFTLNLISASKLFYRRRHYFNLRFLLAILNLIPNVIGVITSTYVLLARSYPGSGSCHTIHILDASAIAFGTTSIAGILFFRAYCLWLRHQWLLWLGIILILCNFILGVTVYCCLPMYETEDHFCLVDFEPSWGVSKFLTDLITNLTLTGMYLYVIRRILRAGTNVGLYRRLYREGFIATFLVILSSFTVAVICLLDLVTGYEPYLYGIDRK
jgi:hypothetical protein